MKMVLYIMTSLAASLGAFLATALAVIAVELGIQGEEAFEHNSGADFALAMLIAVIALPVALATFLFVLSFLHNRSKRAAERTSERASWPNVG